MYFLPALGTLYFALAGIWGLPYGEQLVGTITAIDTFLGVILGISKSKYNKCVSENTGTLAGEQSWQEFFLCCDVSEKAGSHWFLSQSTIFIFLFVQVCSKI